MSPLLFGPPIAGQPVLFHAVTVPVLGSPIAVPVPEARTRRAALVS